MRRRTSALDNPAQYIPSDFDAVWFTDLHEPLTRAENYIASLLREGMSNSDIAQKTQISVYTVTCHITHIFNKVGCSSRLELIAMMIKTDHSAEAMELRKQVLELRKRIRELEDQCSGAAGMAGGAAVNLPPKARLTPAEKRICAILLAGYRNRKELAAGLDCTEQTVQTHMNNIYEKLGVNGKGELISYLHHRVRDVLRTELHALKGDSTPYTEQLERDLRATRAIIQRIQHLTAGKEGDAATPPA